MTALQPHTIVIQTLPAKIPTTLMVASQIEHDMLDDLYGDGDGPRKRRRLTHLSQDEKLLRRKLKNRVAAQTARDRKKNFMYDLEQQVAELQHENRKLTKENRILKSESGSLQQQNVELKGRLSELGFTPIKTEVGTGSAERADPTCVILDEQLHGFNVDSKSDTLVSLLPSNNNPSPVVNKTPVSATETSSLPGAPRNTSNTDEACVVGPTTTELESFKELMQFDHVYFKPQPKSKTDSVGQIKIAPDLLNRLKKFQKVTENGSKCVKNVKIIITSDTNPKLDVASLKQAVAHIPQHTSNSCETVKVDDHESDTWSDLLNDLNFDLLEDLENIMKADTEGVSCPDVDCLQSQTSANGLDKDESKSRGQKRKAPINEIDAIVDTLTSNDDLLQSKTMSFDSDYGSDIQSPYSASSPYSIQDSESLLNDTNLESPLADTAWEESFTELFPDLL